MADNSSSEALLSLEEDLTCSICLSPFENPVSLNCGHSFCLSCLEATWRDATTYFCPQCRAHFLTKPVLKKNTVLSAVVDTFKAKATASGDDVVDEVQAPREKPLPKLKPVLCDTCMQIKAVKTCLTCMASYCLEHVRPHQENPIFRAHELHEPLIDLKDRLCPDHGKLMEFYCARHERSICSSCLQLSHKECGFSTFADEREKKESKLQENLNILDGKIEKNKLVISQMKDQQSRLKEMATSRKRALEKEYQQIRDMLQRDEQEAMLTLDKDLESGHSKLDTLMKKFNQNVEKMSITRAEINDLIARSHSLDFLQASVEMPSVITFDPYAPRINLDSKRIIAYHSSIVSLKEQVSRILHEPVENRITLLKPGERKDFRDPRVRTTSGSNCGEFMKMMDPGPQNRGPPEGARKKQPPKGKKVSGKPINAAMSKSVDNLAALVNPPVAVPIDLNLAPGTAMKRSDLLQYAIMLTFDVRTAHKRVTLSENNHKASVSDEPTMYPENPARFTVCSQVLCTQRLSQGRHYWEMKMNSNQFCGLGLAYTSIDRKGPSSRLGRNAQSWCIEWFNVKLSAWHNSSETVLTNSNPSRVGILLDCDNGTATFYNVSDRAYPFHTFVFPFTEPVHPAFWMFSSGSSITLCKPVN